MRILDSLIMSAFQVSGSQKKSDIVDVVQKLSVEQGIKTSKVVILARIESLLEFVNISRVSVDNKKLATSSLKMINGSDSKSRIVSEMDMFDEGRPHNTLPVSSHQFCKDLSELSDRPYLKITSTVLNSEDFSAALAHLLTEEVCTIFFETAGLKKGGSSSLMKLLDKFPSHFDSKVRVVLLFRTSTMVVFDPFSKYVEQVFGLASLVRSVTSDSTDRRKKLKSDSNGDDKESEDECKLKNEEANEWKERCMKLEKEMEKMEAMNNENISLINKVDNLESRLGEKENELRVSEASRDKLSTEVQTVRSENDSKVLNENIE